MMGSCPCSKVHSLFGAVIKGLNDYSIIFTDPNKCSLMHYVKQRNHQLQTLGLVQHGENIFDEAQSQQRRVNV